MKDPTGEKLRQLGFDVNDSIVSEAIGDAWLMSENRKMFSILYLLGMGDYNFDTGVWTPTSHQVYSFDAEVFDIAHMYTLFLEGVQAIVPDVEISDVQEDLSGITEELVPHPDHPGLWTDGKRGLSFRCNGHLYAVEMTSWGDWWDDDILVFMNGVLEKEGCPNRLYMVSDRLDQLVILLYGTQERAREVEALIRIH